MKLWLAILFFAIGVVIGILLAPIASGTNNEVDDAMLYIAQAQFSHVWWLNAIEQGSVSEEQQKAVGDKEFQRLWLNRYDLVYKMLQEYRNVRGLNWSQ